MTRKSLTLLAALPLAALAFDDNGSYFEHKDWEIACDNTGTCRAAGYQAGDEAQAISLLLVRDAGADAAVSGEIAVTDLNWDDKAPQPLKGSLYRNDKNLGEITLSGDDVAPKARLSPVQSEAVSKAVIGSDKITFRTDKTTWTLSNEGATAVLLKMDDYQGRVGTPSALVKRGSDKKTIPAPAAKPVIHAAAVPDTPPRVLKAGDAEYSALRHLFAEKAGDECPDISESENNITLYPLDSSRILAETSCWAAAYNSANYYAILSPDLKTIAATVDIEDGYDYSDGTIESGGRGRGLGDCFSLARHTWDGKRFVTTYSAGSGQCKGFPGGAWELPTRVSTIIAPNSGKKSPGAGK